METVDIKLSSYNRQTFEVDAFAGIADFLLISIVSQKFSLVNNNKWKMKHWFPRHFPITSLAIEEPFTSSVYFSTLALQASAAVRYEPRAMDITLLGY